MRAVARGGSSTNRLDGKRDWRWSCTLEDQCRGYDFAHRERGFQVHEHEMITTGREPDLAPRWKGKPSLSLVHANNIALVTGCM